MRPRSRLVSKRSLLLPTIREGAEETVRDLNEANTLHIAAHGQAVSSEDYLLSICHLAHPTFPTRDVSPYDIHAQQLDAVHQRLRLSRVSDTFESSPTEEAQEEGRGLHDKLMFGNSDPLEYLYGHQNHLSGGVKGASCVEGRFTRQRGGAWQGRARSRAHSVPRASSPDLPRQRKSSCPELHASAEVPAASVSPEHRRERDRGAEGERQHRAIKQSLISQWISDCRSAWREARVRACMLPAIAEI